MRVAIIGSREIYGYGLDELISHIPQNASELVSGGAAGVDALAEQAAGRLGLPIRVFLVGQDRLCIERERLYGDDRQAECSRDFLYQLSHWNIPLYSSNSKKEISRFYCSTG